MLESPPINPITMLELDALRQRSADLQQKYQMQVRRFLSSLPLSDDNHRKARLCWRLAQQEAEAGVLRWIAQGCVEWVSAGYNPYGTVTGRMNSAGPNLANKPRGESAHKPDKMDAIGFLYEASPEQVAATILPDLDGGSEGPE